MDGIGKGPRILVEFSFFGLFDYPSLGGLRASVKYPV